MKNKKISDAWDKIEPDAAADARMLGAVLARNQPGQSKTRKVYPMKNLNWKRLAPIAACLVLAIAGAVLLPGLVSVPPIAPVKIERMSLPAMLAGQEVTWQNLSVKGTQPEEEEDQWYIISVKDPELEEEDVQWYVIMKSDDGLELWFDSPGTKLVGCLADGRKVVLATEEIRRGKSDEKNAAAVTIMLGAYDAIDVGTTIMEFSHTDETGLKIVYRCYIEAIV